MVLGFHVFLEFLPLEVVLGLLKLRESFLALGFILMIFSCLSSPTVNASAGFSIFFSSSSEEDDPLEARHDFDKDAEIRDPDDLDLDDVSKSLAGKNTSQMSPSSCLMPREIFCLLNVDIQEDRLDFVSDLELVRRLLDLFPADIGDVDRRPSISSRPRGTRRNR